MDRGREGGMEIESDAFTDLYFIWDLICYRYLEAVTAVRSSTIANSSDTGCSASGGSLLRACPLQPFVLKPCPNISRTAHLRSTALL